MKIIYSVLQINGIDIKDRIYIGRKIISYILEKLIFLISPNL